MKLIEERAKERARMYDVDYTTMCMIEEAVLDELNTKDAEILREVEKAKQYLLEVKKKYEKEFNIPDNDDEAFLKVLSLKTIEYGKWCSVTGRIKELEMLGENLLTNEEKEGDKK